MDFDMLFEEGGTSQTAPSSHSHSHPQTHMALRLLRRLCTTEDEKLRKVLELVRESLLVLNAEELQQRHLVVQTAKKALELAGYTTRVVTSGRKGQLCFRHTYLQLVGQGECSEFALNLQCHFCICFLCDVTVTADSTQN